MCKLEKGLLRLGKPSFEGLFWICREVWVSDYKLVKLIPQVVGARSSTMPIVDREEGAPWPVVNLLEFGLDDVENDRDSIFVVVPNHALMRVSRVCHNDAVLLAGELGRVVALLESGDLLLFHLLVLVSLTHRHFHTSVLYNFIETFRSTILLGSHFLLNELCQGLRCFFGYLLTNSKHLRRLYFLSTFFLFQ